MRKIIDLNFGWKYSETCTDEMLNAGYDDSSFETVDIPHANKEIPLNYFDEAVYQFVSCYRKSFRLPEEAYLPGKKVLLRFEGAANYAEVFINGKAAGSHKDAYTPFTIDITPFINKSRNVIAVRLDSTERPEIPPFGNVVDYLVYGGIYREVSVIIIDEIHIEDVFVRTPEVLAPKKKLVADITFSQAVSGEIRLALCDGDKVISEKSCTADNTKIMRINWAIPGVECWQPENPVLYTLKVHFADDEHIVRFGFRTCEFTRKGFFLNGKRIKLRGLNRHQSYPYVGNAMPASAQIADAELLKFKLGCNFVRTSHYPDSVHFLNRCDEIGLLVFTEMPSWQFLGEGEWRQICLENIQDMIIRDRNHPCVVLWGVRVNEGNDCDEFYTETNALAHSLDDSRQTGGVRNFPRSHLLEDVYTYNDFSHSGGPIALLPPTLVAGLRAPYLVTEYNGHMYPTKSFDREEIRREVALRHARVQNKSYSSDRYCGATAWCMSDYNTHKDFGSGDRICYHGVTDMFRVPKLSAAVYASQQDKTPVLEVSSSMDVGEHPGAIIGQIYIFTNCDYVKIYKNGVYKSTAYPDKTKFAHLPHPPIMPSDYIGDSLQKDEGLNETSAKYMKKAMVAAAKYGYIMPPHHYLELAAGVVAGAIPIPRVVDIVTKYFANWGDEQVTYRFDGYKDGEVVKSVTKTAVLSKHLTATADSTTLVEDKTYDVTRIELLCLDQNDNVLPFANNAVKVSIDGPAKIIGPDHFALIGGDRAFWIRTIGKSGDITVTIEAEGLNTQVLHLTAEKK